MRLIFAIMFALTLALSPVAARAEGNCANASLCDAYHNPGPGPKPAIPDMVCIDFVQAGTDTVVLWMYDVYNPENMQDPSNHPIRQPLSKVAGSHGQFCVGRQWIEKATWIMVCNGHKSYDVRLEAFPEQVSAGHISTCLLGVAGCAAL